MKTASIVAACALAVAGATQAQPANAPHYLSARDVAAKVAKTTDGLASAPLPTGPGVTVLVARRDKTGEVEVHARMADQFVVQAGKATAIVGGTLKGDRETAPGERRGGEITGGTRYDLAPGDVLWIPAGLPHQVVVPAGGSFTYVVAKFETKPGS
jgi:mannose-6-phosphate isomerase-like protein (cupin superfamily)